MLGSFARFASGLENGIHYPLGQMFVCICRAVTEQQVAAAIESGASSREAVSRACRAGGDCGACHATIEDMIEEHCDRRAIAADGAAPRRLPLADDRERAA
jgi:bacterioferritin-associated ferredoxin